MSERETSGLSPDGMDDRGAPGLVLPPRIPGLILRTTGIIGLPASLLVAAITLLDLTRLAPGEGRELLAGLAGLQLAGAGAAYLRLRAARWIAADSNLTRAALACRLSLVQEVAILVAAAVAAAATGSSTLTGGAILPAGLIICFAYAWSYGKIMARARSLAGA
jgi:hypothetical protein